MAHAWRHHRCGKPIALALLLGSAGLSGQRAPARAALDQDLAAAIARGVAPGIVAMAADRRGVIYEGAFGLAEDAKTRPMTPDALFRIASMTKPVTSVAAMQLVERGAIHLDDPADSYLPELAGLKVIEAFDRASGRYAVRAAKGRITVRQLLTHTAGLGYPFTSEILRDFKPREGEAYGPGPLLFDPGTRWHYGTNTDWVGRLVEAVSGQTLDAYFREHIFVPLGMHDTFFNVPAGKQPRSVSLHHRQPDGALVEEPWQPPRVVADFNGGGGLWSTAGDYVTFLRMLLGDGSLNGARILSRDSVASMGANHIGVLGVGALKSAMPDRSNDFTFIADGRDKWGLGFLITTDQEPGKRSAGSLSWGGIYNTYFWVDRTTGVAGVILMQFLPFADTKALAVYDAFERGVYRLVDAR